VSLIRRATSAAFVVGAAALACNVGDTVHSPVTGDGSLRDASLAPVPATVPTPACDRAEVGAACTNDPTLCEIGTHPSPSCNALLQCSGITWQLSRAAATCAASCPSSPSPSEAPAACAPTLRCEYDDARTTCGCTRSPPDGGDAGDAGDGGDARDASYVWKCAEAAEGCPSTRPHVGAPCVLPITCDYGSCFFDERPAMRCLGGFWQLAPEPDGGCLDGGSR
jgi:hypothetical protein